MPARWVALPAITTPQRRALIVFGAVVAIAIWLAIVSLAEPYDWSQLGPGHDARPYWTADFAQPYATSQLGAHDAYLYSPAFLELIAPFRALPWQLFMAGWAALLIAATLYLVGPVLLGPVLLLAMPELFGGNITILLAAALVAGFRFPGTWALPLLTKVTPGLGILWFAVRREWRALAIAAATTLGVILLSLAHTPPGEWADWLSVLAVNAGAPVTSGSFPIPFVVRLPVALLVIVWAARSDRRWALPIAGLLALPVIWYGSLSFLLAVIPLALPQWTAWSWRESLAEARERLVERARIRGPHAA